MKKEYDCNIELNNINSLTLITSESCNLQCKYCEIAKNINPKTHSLITKKVKESFINGEYLKNIKAIFKKYKINNQNIKSIDFWGQEPTLTLDAVEIFFPELYKLTPNCSSLFFSTNGVAYQDRLISFAKMLDKTITNKDKNNKFEFRIQFSYDGKDETEKLRGINPEIILKNIDFVIQELNNIEFKNIKVYIQFHNVLSMELVKRLNKNDEALINHFTELNQIAQHFYFLNNNKNVYVYHTFGSGIQTPYNASTEEGKIFGEFAKKCVSLKAHEDICDQFLYASNILLNLTKKYKIKNIINNILFKNQINKELINQLGAFGNCGYGIADLKIRYDGSIIHCQNAIFGLEDPNVLKDDNLSHQIQKTLIEKNYYPNLLTGNEQDIQKFFYRVNQLKQNFCFEYSQLINMMTLMLKCHQIDESYNDTKKLLYHAFLLTTIFSCVDTKIMSTSSAVGREGGLIRYFCNGFMDIIEKEYEKKGVFFDKV